LVTVTVYAIVSVRIKIYNNKNKSMVHSSENVKFGEYNFIANITITIGPALLLIIAFLANYFLGKTRSNVVDSQYASYHAIHFQYLICLPLIFAIFVIFFYTKNKNVKNVLLREWNNH